LYPLLEILYEENPFSYGIAKRHLPLSLSIPHRHKRCIIALQDDEDKASVHWNMTSKPPPGKTALTGVIVKHRARMRTKTSTIFTIFMLTEFPVIGYEVAQKKKERPMDPLL